MLDISSRFLSAIKERKMKRQRNEDNDGDVRSDVEEVRSGEMKKSE